MPSSYNRLDDDGLLYAFGIIKYYHALKSDITITGITVNNSALTPDTNKVVNIIIPTKTSDLTNDSDFQTSTEVQTAIQTAIAGLVGVSFAIVQSLPQSDISTSTIYLVPNSGSGTNAYDEYIYVNNSGTYQWEMLGTTAVDLSGYFNDTNLPALTNSEIASIYTNATPVSGSGS